MSNASVPRDPTGFFRRHAWPLALLALFVSSGCTSAITTTAVREALRGTIASMVVPTPHAAERKVADDDRDAADETVAGAEADQETLAAHDPAGTDKPALSLDQAVERAVRRLSAAGQLDAATQATLLTMLESTNPEDWPAAIDAFAASLEANRPAGAATAADVPPALPEPAPQPVAEPEANALLLPSPAAADTPAPEAVVHQAATATPPVIMPVAAIARPAPAPSEQPAVLRPAPVVEPMPAVIEPEPEAQAKTETETDTNTVSDLPVDPGDEPEETAPATLAIRNACFVTRVKAWGVVERFPANVFRRGQDVIVYFELDRLSCRSSAAGHSTSIDTVFRLVGNDGQPIRIWTFEPIDETSHSPRRDYFARYFLRMPDTAPVGPCRLEFTVTDRLADVSTQTSLDLEITAP